MAKRNDLKNKSIAKKEKIKLIDANKALAPEEEDPVDKAKKKGIMSKADEAKIEAHDEVKVMNSMVNKARC
jgi:hypothetical protein